VNSGVQIWTWLVLMSGMVFAHNHSLKPPKPCCHYGGSILSYLKFLARVI